MDWFRGGRIGHGSFGAVNLAIPRNQGCSRLMAVKSCGAAHSASLMNEKLILDELSGCPEIISCFGDCFTLENGEKLYNVLLDYASGGSLADKLKNSGDHQFPEFEARRYTKDILRGLQFIHKKGYVHCDIKLQNILLGQKGDVKIADFGLAKKAGAKAEADLGCELRGTPMYMSPEMVTGAEQGCSADIWALGCVVAEMVSGAPAWRCSDVAGLLMKIGVGEEVPEIPKKLSHEGKDFLEKCFAKDPRERWTAEKLLDHPFVAAAAAYDHQEGGDHRDTVISKDNRSSEELPTSSPKCPFDFPDWVSEQSSITFSPSSASDIDFDSDWCGGSLPMTAAERLKGLVCDERPNWSDEDDWVTVR